MLRLFLDVPLPLVRVFCTRRARRVASFENADEDAAASADAAANGDDIDASLEEDEESDVIRDILQQQRADEAIELAGGRASREHSASQQRVRQRHAKADAFLRDAGFVQRHWTVRCFGRLPFVHRNSCLFFLLRSSRSFLSSYSRSSILRRRTPSTYSPSRLLILQI